MVAKCARRGHHSDWLLCTQRLKQVAEFTAEEKGEAPAEGAAPAAAAPAAAPAAPAPAPAPEKAKPALPPTKPLEAPEEEQYTVGGWARPAVGWVVEWRVTGSSWACTQCGVVAMHVCWRVGVVCCCLPSQCSSTLAAACCRCRCTSPRA